MAINNNEKIIVSIGADTSGLKQAGQELDNLQDKVEEVGNTTLPTKSFDGFKKQLREARLEAERVLQAFGENSPQYKNALKGINEITNTYDDFKRNIQTSNPDKPFQALVGAGAAATKSLQGVTALVQGLGLSSKSAEEQLVTLQSIMAFGDALNSLDDITDGFKDFGKEILNSTLLQKANAAATGLAAGVMSIFSKSVDVSSTSVKVLSNVFKGLGIGLIIAGVAALVMNWDKLTGKLKDATDLTEEYNNISKATAENASKDISKLTILRQAIEDVNIPMGKRIELVKQLKKDFPEYFSKLTNEQILTGNVANAYNDAANAIIRKARANAAAAEIEKLTSKQLEIELRQQENLIKLNKDITNAKDDVAISSGGGIAGTGGNFGGVSKEAKIKALKENFDLQADADKKEIQQYSDKINTLIKLTNSASDTPPPQPQPQPLGNDKVKTTKEENTELINLKKELNKELSTIGLSAIGQELATLRLEYEQRKNLANGDKKALEQIEEAYRKKKNAIADKYIKEEQDIEKANQAEINKIKNSLLESQLSPEKLELKQLEDKYKEELKIIGDNEELKKQLKEKYEGDIDKIQTKYRDKAFQDRIDAAKKEREQLEDIKEAEKISLQSREEAYRGMASNVIGILQSLGRNSKAVQAAAIIADAAVGIAQAVIANKKTNAELTVQQGKLLGIIFTSFNPAAIAKAKAGFIKIGAAKKLNSVATGVNVAGILAAKGAALAALGEGGSGGGSASAPATDGSQASAPQVTAADAQTPSNVRVTNDDQNNPIRAIVVDRDIQNQQKKRDRLNQLSSFG
jgi:hypothetical protein